jgi:hypothetical protein
MGYEKRMMIKVERTGGFAGISKSSELHCEELPSELENTIKQIIKNTKTSSLPLKLSSKRSCGSLFI